MALNLQMKKNQTQQQKNPKSRKKKSQQKNPKTNLEKMF